MKFYLKENTPRLNHEDQSVNSVYGEKKSLLILELT
jgi:hypothetical protein